MVVNFINFFLFFLRTVDTRHYGGGCFSLLEMRNKIGNGWKDDLYPCTLDI